MKKELLYSLTKKDFKLQTFRSGGPGGQHQNKTDSGVRITHKVSGGVGESRQFKSQYQNRKAALKRLINHPKFKIWNNRKCHEIISGKTLDDIIQEMMEEKNLKFEIINDEGKWEKWEQ
jgi:protein subunit release factor B